MTKPTRFWHAAVAALLLLGAGAGAACGQEAAATPPSEDASKETRKADEPPAAKAAAPEAAKVATGPDAAAAKDGTASGPEPRREAGGGLPVNSDPTQELRANDRLRFRIEQDPAKSAIPQIVTVNSLGEANFPVTRESDIRVTLLVRGKTLGKVREELVERLLADYYHRATVELGVEEKMGVTGKAVFFGEMGGTVPITPDQPVKLSEAILQLRAPESARLSRVRVHRENPATGQTTVLEVDVDAINKKGQREKDIVLQDGDRIEVRQKWFN